MQKGPSFGHFLAKEVIFSYIEFSCYMKNYREEFMKFFSKKFSIGALLMGSCLLGASLIACSEGSSSEDVSSPNVPDNNENVVAMGSSEATLWRSWNLFGVPEYFDSLENASGKAPLNTNLLDDLGCKFPALMMDALTENLDELEYIFQEGFLVKGVCGLALNLKDGQVAPLGINLTRPMSQGTVEFWFRPGEDFFDKPARTLLGNDEARLHFFVKDGELIFQKNHADQHFFVKAPVDFGSGWTKIGGQWGDGYLSLWVNDSLVARMEHTLGYEPSTRGKKFGNLLVIGYKSYCCMEPTGQYQGMTTSGSFDQFRISRTLRYKNLPDVVDTTVVDTVITADTAAPAKKHIESSTPIYSENFDMGTDLGEVSYVEGVSGKALSIKSGEKVVLPFSFDMEIPYGYAEFDFKPDSAFNYKNSALLGSNEGRMSFLVLNQNLYFFKNGEDEQRYVSGPVKFNDGWNKIRAEWLEGSMSLYVNGTLIASAESDFGFMPSYRTDIYNYDKIMIGYKDECCMSEVTTNIHYGSGTFDNIVVNSFTIAE